MRDRTSAHGGEIRRAAGRQNTLHVYAQPGDPAFLEAQRGFAAEHPWFQVEKLDAFSHFPVFEVPDAIATHLARFAAQL